MAMPALLDLPLFPLHSVVVPFMSLPLHVFEDRYKQLVSDCRAGDNRFGVLLIRRGEEVGGPAEPYEVGAIVEITSVEELPTGAYRVETMARERFRVSHLWHDRPYLRCHAQTLPDEVGDPHTALSFDVQVRALTADYVSSVYRALGDGERRHVALPDDSLTLSYAVAMLLSVHVEETQSLLEAPTVASRLALEADLLRRELAILRQMLVGRPRFPETGTPRYSPN